MKISDFFVKSDAKYWTEVKKKNKLSVSIKALLELNTIKDTDSGNHFFYTKEELDNFIKIKQTKRNESEIVRILTSCRGHFSRFKNTKEFKNYCLSQYSKQ